MEILAVLRRRTESFSEEAFAPLLEPEAQMVRRLYIDGVIRSVWSRTDTPGAVMLIEAESVEQAREIAATFPLARAEMLELESVIPLRGYRGFAPR